MTSRLHFLPWNQPLLGQAVDFLAGAWTGTGPLDLSDALVVVPTKQSGRRLREALAARAAEHGQAVLSPRVVPPDALVALGLPATGIASRMTGQLAWAAVLRAMQLEDFRAVFPAEPPTGDPAWVRRMARQFQKVQTALAEAGLRMADVNARAGTDFPEAARWSQLAQLESRYDAALAAHGLRDLQEAKIEHVRIATPPEGIRRVVVIGTPDPLPLAVQILSSYGKTVPVDIVVCGPADESPEALFDEWGRPIAAMWSGRNLAWADFEKRVRLCADPRMQAQQMVGLLTDYGTPEASIALGVADPEVLGVLEPALRGAGLPAFNPEGRPRVRDGLYALLAGLAALARDDSFSAAAAVLRNPDVLEWLATEIGDYSRAKMLERLDRLQATHLPPTLDEAARQAKGEPVLLSALAALRKLQGIITTGEFPANADAALATIFSARRFPPDSPVAESAGAWQEISAEAASALALFPASRLAERWDLALEHYGDLTAFVPRTAGALELNGWLELLWEDAPHLVVAGVNDGFVPDAVVGDAFLPEGLRVRLGLKTNSTRFARDAYLLSALATTRQEGGRLDLLLGKVALSGEPLRPSRLLLRCPEAELPRRVEFLFREVATDEASVPWTRAWQLRPRRVPPPARLSVTALRAYLACPFRFYLRYGLGMEEIDPSKAELDAKDFGTLLHEALRSLGDEEALRGCADESVLRDALLGAFERKVHARYGELLTLPLVVQFESARQRLRRAAAVQAVQCAQGWQIVQAERSFQFPLGGVTISGTIDRIDRHADGRVRVLDYKSTDKRISPADAHLGRPSANKSGWEPARVMHRGDERCWLDLQLPMYRRALADEFGPEVTTGYFNLPKAVGDTAVDEWSDWTPELQAAAEQCAGEVAAAVAAGRFWPPTELSEREDEDWAGLFHQGAAASIVPDWPEGEGA